MQLDLAKNDGSILFAASDSLHTSDGKTLETVAMFHEGLITGFEQLNESHVVLVNRNQHCLKILDRQTNNVRIFAGTCGSQGYREGAVNFGLFTFPSNAIKDSQTPRLFVTDVSNHAVRAVGIHSGELSTLIKSGFNRPRKLMWAAGSLFVSNAHYISEISWLSDGSVINTKIVGSTYAGYVDSSFADSRFNVPRVLLALESSMFLLADQFNNVLRLLDFNKQEVRPVCFFLVQLVVYFRIIYFLYRKSAQICT